MLHRTSLFAVPKPCKGFLQARGGGEHPGEKPLGHGTGHVVPWRGRSHLCSHLPFCGVIQVISAHLPAADRWLCVVLNFFSLIVQVSDHFFTPLMVFGDSLSVNRL